MWSARARVPDLVCQLHASKDSADGVEEAILSVTAFVQMFQGFVALHNETTHERLSLLLLI